MVAMTLAPVDGAEAQALTGSLSLVSQTTVVRGGQNLVLCVRLRDVRDPERLELAVVTYSRMRDRTRLLRTIDGKSLDRDEYLVVIPLDRVAMGACGNESVYIITPPPPEAEAGVYPVAVELRESDNSTNLLSRLITHMVYVPSDSVERPMNVALVLPVHDAPALQPGGARHLSRSGPLAELANALQAVPDVPVVLDPTPETVDALARAKPGTREAVTALRESVRDRQVLAGPYVPVDFPAMRRADLGDEADSQLAAGTDIVAARLLDPGRRPDPRTWIVRDAVDEESLADLRGRGFDRVVLPAANLSPLRDSVSTANRERPFIVEARTGSRQSAFVADPDLAGHFTRGDQVLRAHQLIADLAFLYFELPNEPSGARGVVAVAPRTWRPSGAFLRTLLLGLRDNPVVRPMTLDSLFGTVPAAVERSRPLVRTLVSSTRSTTYPAVALRSARARVDGLASVFGRDNPLPSELRDRLLASESVDLRPGRRNGYVQAVNDTVKRELGRIKLPTGRTITLTAREGEIPISFRNETGHPVRVQVRLESDKLIVRDRDRVRPLDLVQLNTTARFLVKARTSGDTGLNITVESPDGTLPITNTLLTVRSTAASGVGLLLSAGAALFLVVWWGRDIWRKRRGPKSTPQ
jgi:hypothetical protein